VNVAGWFKLTVKSDPEGFIPTSKIWKPPGELAQTQEIWDNVINGYRFVGWTLDGVEVRDAWGASKTRASVNLTKDSVAVARYVPQGDDIDLDGILDWMEYLYFGVTFAGPMADTDWDKFALWTEITFGMHPGIADTVREGGISRRSSAAGNYIFKWLPWIEEDLSTVQVKPGAAVTLSVKADGLGPFTYEWYRNGLRETRFEGA
jgi:hypothetical protein